MRHLDESPWRESAAMWAARKLLASAKPKVREDICEWCESHIDLSFDHTSSATGLVKLYPYQREILRATDDPDVQEVTIQAGQRLGKSQCWKFSLLKRVHDGGLSGLIMYPNLDLAERTNRDTVRPLLCTLADVNRDLSRRGNVMVNSYHMPSVQSVLYFLGGGSQAISATANWVVLDECDFTDLEQTEGEGRNMSQLRALRLRMQTFKRRMMIVCSSPTTPTGVVTRNWEQGSKGSWHLRCLGCGGLFPSKQLAYPLDGGRWAGLQWRKSDTGDIVEDSVRWICPACGRAHEYAEAWRMNELGQFVHARESNTRHRSFQIGALANPSLWCWREIAEAQEQAVDTDGRKFLDNAVLGMPYRHVKEGDPTVSIEDANRARQIDYPSDLGNRLSIVVAGIDQQKSELAGLKYFVSVVRGWDEEGNSYLLSAGTDNSLDAVEARTRASYYGVKPAVVLIDQGGFSNADDVDPYVASHPEAYYYKGTNAKNIDGKMYLASTEQRKLFLASALGYQVKLLDLLYSPKRPSGYRWYLPTDCDEEYFRQLCNVKPNTRMGKDGNGWEYANYAAFNGARRDFFDAEKMALCALDLALEYLPPSAFRSGRIPLFAAREKILAAVRLKKGWRR